MRKLSKPDIIEKNQLAGELEERKDKLEDALAVYAAAIDEAWSKLERDVESYNEKLEEVQNFVGNIVSQMEDYVSERSDRWQESDAASDYSSWQSDWENVSTLPLELEEPSKFEDTAPELTGRELLDDLSESVDG